MPPNFLGFPDNAMDSLRLLEIVKAIEGVISRTQPEVVYTHNRSDLNIDHDIVARAVLTATDLTFSIDGARLLDRVSVEFAPGRLSVVIGPNGAGKSTLVKVLSRQLAPQAGEVRYADRPLASWEDRDLARVRAVLSQAGGRFLLSE